MKERIGYYDIARGLGIIFVVIGHIDTFYMPFRNVVISFHMGLFLIISGMLFFEMKEENKPYANVIIKRFCRVMIPYFLLSLISVLIEFFRLALQDIYHWPHIKSLLYSVFSLRGNSVMWFLPALFISECMFLTVRKCKKDWLTWILVLGLVLLAIWGNTKKIKGTAFAKELNVSLIRGIFCTIFICVGYYLRKWIDILKKPKSAGYLIALLLLGVSVKMNRINPKVDLRAMKWGEAWFSTDSKFVLHAYLAFLYLIGAMAGAIAIILICRNLERFSKRAIFRMLAFWGSNSLIIMATHLDWHVLHYSMDLAAGINRFLPSSLFYHGVLLVIVFAVESVLIILINKFAPIIAGKIKFKKIS